jgi:hypothetical protein
VNQFGFEAIVHEAPITVPGWRGSGYILTHPETGAGSYMIDGGKNGAWLLILAGVLLLLAVFLMPWLAPAIFAALGMVWILALFGAGVTAFLLGISQVSDDPDAYRACMIAITVLIATIGLIIPVIPAFFLAIGIGAVFTVFNSIQANACPR